MVKKTKVLVCGSSGFIGYNLVAYLKGLGYWVRGADIKRPEFGENRTDEFWEVDLRNPKACQTVTAGIDEVYQLAADMGGMGFIATQHVASLHNSNLINTYLPEACVKNHVKRLFFSSSVCVYPTHRQNSLRAHYMSEEMAIPANPNEAYGWEKLIAEIRYQAYEREYGLAVRIARFDNTYGPFGTHEGGREKAPAALCRKVALARDGDEIEVWGDGKQTRPFLYIDDNVRGIYQIMRSDCNYPINLGPEKVVTIDELAKTVIRVSGKNLSIKHVDGPQGTRSRYIVHKRAEALGWSARVGLLEGITKTYTWIKSRYER